MRWTAAAVGPRAAKALASSLIGPSATSTPAASLDGEWNCHDHQPRSDGAFETTSTTLTITGQTGERLEGTTTITATVRGDAFNAEATFSGAITVSGDLSGTFSYVSQRNGAVASSGNGTFTGSGNDSDLTLRFSGRASSGDTCTFDGQLTVQR